ncbi:hypothetical protein G6020_14965 [Dietzia sp. B19]|uniref:hypothetical protein n=1 Tax=Dietzia sp. B19 TaxID=1630632 RepID=UPI0015F93969|nr:hypothetical protein [Dietzia sp. B19]MBB1058653.1 hypothetical protein [Dietzia sp. B19]
MSDWLDPRGSTSRRVSRDAGGLDSDGGWDGLDDFEDGGTWFMSAPTPGAALPPFRPSLTLQRTRFFVDLSDTSTATVDVDHTSGSASLYRDGQHTQTSAMPVRFPLGADSIDVVAGRYGMHRIHLIRADGSQRRLDPAPGTPEFWRARLSRRHPRMSLALSVCAVIVLTVNLVLLAPQALELITHLPLWSDRFAPFTSPVVLPAWANSALTVTAGLAAIERALTFRRHRLLDVETDGLGA